MQGPARSLVGTRVYAAPEVGDGDQEYDFGADIWSAGGVLVYLLFKQHPFAMHSNAGRLLTTAELNERKQRLLINWPPGAFRHLTHHTAT
jgi:serine/threonine protein kinase